jgi:ribosomal protein S18 acetylase RimI-like enzyme
LLFPYTIIEESISALPEYGAISIAFTVASRLRIEPIANSLGGFQLIEEQVAPPYLKDYDQDDGERPVRWLQRWDISNWGILAAFDGTQRIGGAVMAWKTPGVFMLQDRTDLAVLWDIRIAENYRRRGIGAQLFARAVEWARARECRLLKIETQNINVAACKFYARQGCVLGGIHRWAYADFPDEVQLLWYRGLAK